MPTEHNDPTIDSGDALGEALRLFIEHRSSGSGESDSQLLERNPSLRELLEPLLSDEKPAQGEIRPGAVIGDYRLIEPIGRGGMGEVWEAEQISLRRRVALKLLRAQIFASSHSIERFQREALAGARLKHPGIVSVYAVGEVAGVHFIAQELIETRRTLTHLVRDIRELPAIPATYWRETAQRFVQLADALQLAHESGVIHRDIKPSNILLTADGSPKIADFGLALVAGESELSRSGDLSGSPFYMSPEQAIAKRIGIDARSDVFSLGATLFEALTLQRPFEGDTVAQVLTKIMFDDPRDPRDIRSLCPRDLAVICLKMLEKAPSKRYRSMREVADELQRFQRNEPIRARPPGVIGRTLKWTRRHPVWAASGTIICISLGVVTALLVETHRARTAAESSATAARNSSAAATASAEQARVEAKTSSRITDFLVDAFLVSNPNRALGREITAREVLDRGVKNIRGGLTEVTEMGPRARLLGSFGMVYSRLGQRKDAENLLLEAKELETLAFGPRDSRTLELSTELAMLYAENSRFEPALALTREVFEAQVSINGADSREALGAEGNLGSILSGAGKLELAEPRLRHAAAGLKQLGEWYAPALYSWSEVLRGLGREAESMTALNEALGMYEVAMGPDSPETLNTREGLARHAIANGKYAEGARLWREIANSRECVQGPKHPATLRCRGMAASYEMMLVDPKPGTAELRTLYATCQQEFGDNDPTTLVIAKQIGNLLLNMKQFDEAEGVFVLLLSDLANQPLSSAIEVGGMLTSLGIVERNLGRAELALSLFLEVTEALDPDRVANPRVLDICLRQMIDLRIGLEQYQGALEAARRWLDSAPKNHPMRASVERAAKELEEELGNH